MSSRSLAAADLLQAGGENKRGQGHPQRVRAQARRQVGEPLGLGGLTGQRLQVVKPRGELGGEVGKLFGLVLGAVVGGHGVVVGLARRLDRRLRAGQVGGRVQRHRQVGVGEQLSEGPGRGLVLADSLVGRGPPGGVPPSAAGRVQVGEPGLGGGLDGQAPSALAVVLGAGGGVGSIGGGAERIGGLADRAQRGVQVGPAAELSQHRLAVPLGPMPGLGGLAEARFALFGQFGKALLGGHDNLVEGLERGLELAVPGRGAGQPDRLGLLFAGGRSSLAASACGEVESPAAVDPASASRADRSVTRTSAAAASRRSSRPSPAARGDLGHGDLFLLAGHPLAAELA